MSKKRKITVSGILSVLLIAASVKVTFASAYYNEYVYGERYRVVASGTSDNGEEPYIMVSVSKINKSDGTGSTYKTILTDVLRESGDQISKYANYPIYLNSPINIPLYKSFPEGMLMRFRMKGNDSTLDCIVDFTVSLTP